jgi:selenocysteine lyase/cysteine desulfurase
LLRLSSDPAAQLLAQAQGGEIPLELYERAIDERTGLVCISSASYASGAQLPIKAVVELAHARGALCLVDAYQTVGAVALDGSSRRFAEGLRESHPPAGPLDVGKLGPMVAVPVVGDAHELQERLRHEEAVITSARGNLVRFAFHFYNDESDVDACLNVVRRRFSRQP